MAAQERSAAHLFEEEPTDSSMDISYIQLSQAKTASIPRVTNDGDGSRSHRGDHGGIEPTKDRPTREGGLGGFKSQRKLDNFAERRGLWEKKAQTPGSAIAVLPENQPRSRYRMDMGAKALSREKKK